jgi:uncharacterized membrane protein
MHPAHRLILLVSVVIFVLIVVAITAAVIWLSKRRSQSGRSGRTAAQPARADDAVRSARRR